MGRMKGDDGELTPSFHAVNASTSGASAGETCDVSATSGMGIGVRRGMRSARAPGRSSGANERREGPGGMPGSAGEGEMRIGGVTAGATRKARGVRTLAFGVEHC